MTLDRGDSTSRRHALGLLAGAGAFAFAAGCTRTVYVIQNPDGTYTEVAPPDTPDRDNAVVDDGLIIQLLTSNSYVLEGHPVHLMVLVEAPQAVVTTRAPLNVGLVLDRSGSMNGGKLEGAKDAAAHVLDQLADGDRFSLVSYASDVSVNMAPTVMSPHTRRVARSAIDRMYAAGGTFLAGGLDAACRQVRRSLDGQAMARVVLLSDGMANVGETSPYRLASMASAYMEQGVSITTMGLGYDYNEDLMTALAVNGGGEYYYIEHSRSLAQSFGRELNAFGATVGRDVELNLELPAGVRVDNVYGYRHQQQGRQVRVKLSNVAAGQKRRLLMTLTPPSGRGGSFVVANPTVSYRHEKTKRRRNVRLKPVRVTATRDTRLVARSFNRSVVEKLETVRNAAVRQKVMRHMDTGNYAAAQNVLRARRQQGGAIARSTNSGELKKQLRALDDLSRQVKARPAPSSRAYKHFRKSRSKEAFDMYRR